MIKNMNYSVGLEHDDYANDRDLVIKDALAAVADTGVGYYVNVVTPASFGNPADYLTELMDQQFGDRIQYQFIDQCGCGGYVLRVWKLTK
ncbi:MAG: CGCGG family rSAM-modified RiPP protein [Desulfitobacterium sp.]